MKQEAPLRWRPYPPIKAALARMGVHNWNYLVNQAVGKMLGVPEGEIEKYKREKKHDA